MEIFCLVCIVLFVLFCWRKWCPDFQVLVAALKFFLGKDPDEEKDSDSEDEVSYVSCKLFMICVSCALCISTTFRKRKCCIEDLNKIISHVCLC